MFFSFFVLILYFYPSPRWAFIDSTVDAPCCGRWGTPIDRFDAKCDTGPVEGTILEKFINFRYMASKQKMYQFATERERRMFAVQPLIFQRFDWIFWGTVVECGKFDETPRTVLSSTSMLRGDGSVIDFNSLLPVLEPGEKRTLVVTGGDRPWLSEQLQLQLNNETLNGIFQRFSSVFYEAKDIHHSHVKTLPIGFAAYYLLPAFDRAAYLIRAASIRYDHQKTKLVMAAWGRVWPVLDSLLEDRKELNEFLSLNSTMTWLRRRKYDFDEYWTALYDHKYALCPLGNGVQAPKIFEALIMRTVPVVSHSMAALAEDLQNYGFPLLVVERWESLSKELLEEEYEHTFRKVNWERVSRMLTIESVWNLIMNGDQYPF